MGFHCIFEPEWLKHFVLTLSKIAHFESNDNRECVSSTCNYGNDFIASVRRGNVHAVQFHPQKSGDVCLSVLGRFLYPSPEITKKPVPGTASKLAKRVINADSMISKSLV